MVQSRAEQAHKLRFDELVAPLRDDLYRYVYWLGHNAAVADDVVQETMLRAFRALDTLEDEGAVKAWLLTIARREHARWYERKRPEMRDVDDLSPAESKHLATEHDTDVDDMRRAITALDPAYREPLVLQVVFGLTTAEIATTMQVNQGTVLTRLHRARKKLVDIVGADLRIEED